MLYDREPPARALAQTWTVAGPIPAPHERAKDAVREAFPLLAHHLERLAKQISRRKDRRVWVHFQLHNKATAMVLTSSEFEADVLVDILAMSERVAYIGTAWYNEDHPEGFAAERRSQLNYLALKNHRELSKHKVMP